MSWSDLNDLLLTAIVTYGSVALALIFMLTALGAPLPATLCLIAAGAFVQQGVLSPVSTITLGLAGVVLGDTLSYGTGRLLRIPIQRRYAGSKRWLSAEASFAHQAGRAIVLTRFLLTPLALPVNLIAGGSRYPARRFVLYAAGGELVWVLGYGALGYAFGSHWEYASSMVSNAGGLLLGLAVAAAGIYALVRTQPRRARDAAPAAELCPAAGDEPTGP